MSQQPGQDKRRFMEQLKSAATEADIEGINLEDALCLTLLSDINDARLREKLSELEQPTLPAFGALIDAYLHSKATSGVAHQLLQTAPKGGIRSKNKNKNGGGQQKISDSERKRCKAVKGKCFCYKTARISLF